MCTIPICLNLCTLLRHHLQWYEPSWVIFTTFFAYVSQSLAMCTLTTSLSYSAHFYGSTSFSLWPVTLHPHHFSYECRSPDGSCILSCSNDNKLRLFNLPQSVLQPRDSDQTSVGSPEMVGFLCVPPHVPVVLQAVVCHQSSSVVLPVQYIQQA